ncbi:MAG: ferritin family protein, partial [Deltaproteobacteria bacterium]|nr:ferritin family protein [Deltaproteobacteria bacterium]
MHWEGLEATGPADMGMPFVKGDETPQEIIGLAYGMEKGLGELYRTVAGIVEDREVAGLLARLAGIEDNHKKKLFDLYVTLYPDTTDKEAFEATVVSDVMEGGFSIEEFLEENKKAMNTASGVLNIAMMLETQALDLYLRYSQKVEEEKSKTLLHNIADEE